MKTEQQKTSTLNYDKDEGRDNGKTDKSDGKDSGESDKSESNSGKEQGDDGGREIEMAQ